MPLFEASPQESITGFFQRNARLIAGAGLFVTFWMLVYTFAIYKPQYAAKSVVIIRDSAITSRYIEPDNYYALQTTSSSSSNPVLNTMGILKSGAISEALLAYFQQNHPEQLKKNKITTKKDWDSFYQDGSSFIKAKNQPGTDLISIQFSWSDPVIAKEGLSVIVEAFQNASRDLNKEEQINRTKFLNKQVIEIESKLATIRTQKSNYQSLERTVSVKREGDDLAGSRMELSNKLSQLESQAQGKENMARRYQQLLGMDAERALKASAIGQNSSMSKLQDELYHLQQQYSLLNSSLTETNPKVREVQAQIDQVKANIQAEKARTVGKLLNEGDGNIVADGTRNTLITNMLQAQGEAQDLHAQASIISNRLNQVNRDISSFPEMAEGLANIEQKEASLSAALDQLREKVLEGKLKEEQTLSNVFIVDAPRLPEKAQFPNRSHLIVLSVVLGFGVGVAVAFGREQLVSTRRHALPGWLESIDTPAETPTDEPPHDDPPTHSGNGNGGNSSTAIPAGRQAQPEPSPVMAQSRFVPDTIADTQDERRNIPVTGWLFDSIVPVAGPIARTAKAEQSEHQSNLAANPIPVIIPPQAAEELQRTTPIILPEPIASTEPLVHPLVETTTSEQSNQEAEVAASELPAPSKTVKISAPVDSTILSERLEKTIPQPDSTLQNIPALHATIPVEGQPTVQDDSQQAAENEALPETVIDAEPSLQADPIIAEPAEESTARTAYETQAKAMPLPKKRRSLPSFLLEDEVEEPKAPYTLVSRKQLLSPEDDLMQDVEPLEAPAHTSVEDDLDELFFAPLESFDESFDEPADTAAESQTDAQNEPPLKSPIPGFMLNEPVKSARKALFGGSLFGKKPDRHPEVYFGLGARSKKQKDMPASLNRLMQTLDH